MKGITLPIFIVLAMIAIDLSISITYAKEKVKIYKVTKVSPSGNLRLRAWPSSKSRIKASLPYNAKDLVETGKHRTIGKSQWTQVKWKNQIGWINARYLLKTGVLLRNQNQNNQIASRNSKAITTNTAKLTPQSKLASTTHGLEKNTISNTAISDSRLPLPNEYQGDRYDQTLQPTKMTVASKTSYLATQEKQNRSKWILNCAGNSPKNWKIKMDVSAKKMFVKLAGHKEFNVPITYRKWAPGGQVRMEIGGGKGRNLVDATLEKTLACNNGLSKTNYSYMVNAAVNRGELLSGCCNPVAR